MRPEGEKQTEQSFRPTGAKAGSLEKIEVMRRRLERGQPIHHDRDNRQKVEPRPTYFA